MKNLNNNIYKLTNVDRTELKDAGWRFSISDSNAEEHCYKYRFPVYKYNDKTMIECVLTLMQETAIVDIEVYNINGLPYAPFYDDKYSKNNLVLALVNKNISNKLRKLGIVNESVHRRMRKRM